MLSKRSRQLSTMEAHTFDLCLVSPIPVHYSGYSQEEALQLMLDDSGGGHGGGGRDENDGSLCMSEHWDQHFAAHGEPIEDGKHLYGRLCEQHEERIRSQRPTGYGRHSRARYTDAESQMYCGLWIERRARKLGLKVHVTCSRDRDEILRHYDMSLDRMEALLIEHPELDKELPCVRDVEKAHSRLFSYKYASRSKA